MRRILLGILLIAHGLAHASARIWMSNGDHWWLAASLWWIAAVGFIVVGASVLGVGSSLRWWRPLVVVSSLSSLALIVMGGQRVFIVGAAIDVIALFVALRKSLIVDGVFWDRPHPPAAARIGLGLFIAYVALVTGTRNWSTKWGSTLEEQRASLIGDPLIVDPRYRIDHAVTIEAPVDSVWPWLAKERAERSRSM